MTRKKETKAIMFFGLFYSGPGGDSPRGRKGTESQANYLSNTIFFISEKPGAVSW